MMVLRAGRVMAPDPLLSGVGVTTVTIMHSQIGAQQLCSSTCVAQCSTTLAPANLDGADSFAVGLKRSSASAWLRSTSDDQCLVPPFSCSRGCNTNDVFPLVGRVAVCGAHLAQRRANTRAAHRPTFTLRCVFKWHCWIYISIFAYDPIQAL